MIVHIIPTYFQAPVRLAMVKGLTRIAAGITMKRLLSSRQFFRKTPFVNARTSPAVRNAKVLLRNTLD